MATPIFILGVQRSGTTWLANMLCNHPDIAGVQAEEHYGIHESAFFSHVEGFFGNLEYNNNFIQFVEVFGSSDYFQLTGLQKDLLYQARPNTYAAAFRIVMDAFAAVQGAIYWLEKTPAHALYIERLAKEFPNAQFITIQRDPIGTIRSFIKRNPRNSSIGRKIYIAKLGYHYAKYRKLLRRDTSGISDRVLNVHYEDLLNHRERVVRQVTDFLGLNFEDALLSHSYEKNTSFAASDDRQCVLSRLEVWMIKKWVAWLSVLPACAFRFQQWLVNYFGTQGLPAWFWKIHAERMNAEKARSDSRG